MRRWETIQVGMVFGHWTVTGECFKCPTTGKRRVSCVCACGRDVIVSADGLLNGTTTKCRVCGDRNRHEDAYASVIVIGAVFGKWRVLDLGNGVGTLANPRKCRCLCLGCDGEYDVSVWALVHEKTKGCVGCHANTRRMYFDITPTQNLLYGNYQVSARKRGLAFNIDRREFVRITSMDCAYCGIGPSNTHKKPPRITTGDDYHYNGIDRVDSDIGYVVENCVPCCRTCNMAKRDMPIADWNKWIQRLIAHQNQRSYSSPESIARCTES